MGLFSEPVPLPDDFAGVVRLFPLPNVVMFPHVVQALHVFEPRYRALLEDALAGDQLMAMARLQPGWEADYEGRPPIFPTLCVGRVLAHARLEDGRYNILLHGIRRAEVLREFDSGHSFRLAEVAIQEDVYPAEGATRRSQIQRGLWRAFQKLAPTSPAAQEQLEQLLSQPIPLGVLSDIVAYTLPLELEVKQNLLAQANVDMRAEQLLAQLERLAEGPGDSEPPFPPFFSTN